MSLLLGKKPKLEECLGGGGVICIRLCRSTEVKAVKQTSSIAWWLHQTRVMQVSSLLSVACNSFHSPAPLGRPLVRLHRERLLLGERAIPSHFEDLPCATPPPHSLSPVEMQPNSAYIFFLIMWAIPQQNVSNLCPKKRNWIFFFFWRGVQLGLLGGLRLSVDSNSGGEPTFVRCKRPTASQLFLNFFKRCYYCFFNLVN